RAPGQVDRPEPGDHEVADTDDRHHESHCGPRSWSAAPMAAADSIVCGPLAGLGPALSAVAGGGATARLEDEDAPAEQQQDDRQEAETEQPQRDPGHGQPPSPRPQEAPPPTTPTARSRRHHAPPPGPRDLSQPIAAQTAMKIVTMSPITASGSCQPRTRADCRVPWWPGRPGGRHGPAPTSRVGLGPPRDSRDG